MRQLVLDTETTGLDPRQGHRVIEVACLEIVNRRVTGNFYHQYINPKRPIDAGAAAVHNITSEFLADKPEFHQVIDDFLTYIKGAELIIHNATFDLNFLDSEFNLAGKKYKKVLEHCTVIDTLPLARQLHPGQRNSLDALCKRYGVNNSHREFHGALLDSELLALVYLAMTGGQSTLFQEESDTKKAAASVQIKKDNAGKNTPIIKANEEELLQHQTRLNDLQKASGEKCLWGE